MEMQGLGNSSGFREALQMLLGREGEKGKLFRNSSAAFFKNITWVILKCKSPKVWIWASVGVKATLMEKRFSFIALKNRQVC